MWTRIPNTKPNLVGDVSVLAIWQRADGLEIVRVPNAVFGQRDMYSIRDDDGAFWTDKAGRRRSWSELSGARDEATKGKPTEEAVDDNPPISESAPPNTPKPAPRKRKRKARAVASAEDPHRELRARARQKDVTFGDIVEEFGLKDVHEAIKILHGKRQ